MIYRPDEGHESAIFNKLTDESDSKSFLELNLRNSVMAASHIYFYPSTCHIVTTTILKTQWCFNYHSSAYNMIEKYINTFSMSEWNKLATLNEVAIKDDLPMLYLLLILFLWLNPEWEYSTTVTD